MAMNRTLLALAFASASALVALPAAADTTQLEGGCEFQAGADCTASCAGDLSVYCDAQVSGNCVGGCDVTPPQCSASCQGSCTGDCTANPGNFDCAAHCEGDCSGTCDAHCSASSDGTSSQADCVAK